MTKLPPPTNHLIPDARGPTSDIAADARNDAADSEAPSRRWVFTGGGVVLALLIAVLAWILHTRGTGVRYTTEPVTRGPLTVAVTATGTLQPINQVEIGSEISGTIRSVLVDYNDPVTVGQVLARIDTTRLEAQVKQSRAALAAAEAKVLQAEATRVESDAQFTRLLNMSQLTGGTIPSASDLDAAKATLERAKADVTSARAVVMQNRATLEAQQTDLGKAVIRSPIDGVVLQRSVETGQTVAASLQAPVLFVLAENLQQIELHVDVDEADVSSVAAGQAASFTVDAFPDRKFDARVTLVHVGPRTVSGVVTYETVLSVDNSRLALRPGMTATANIVVQHVPDALLIPNAALRFTPETATDTTVSRRDGLVGRLLPRMPARGDRRQAPAATDTKRAWILRDGQPAAIDVRAGVTDGVDTQIVAGNLPVGTAVIVDSTTARQ